MTELTQQAFDRISELAKNAIKERDVAREALRRIQLACTNFDCIPSDEDWKAVEQALTFRADGDER